MKKFLGILAIAGALVACNNSANGDDATADSLRRDSLMRDSIQKAQQMNTPITPTDSIPGNDSLRRDSLNK